MEFALYSKLSEESDLYIPQPNNVYSMEFSSSSHQGATNRVLNNLDYLTVDASLSNPCYDFYHYYYDPFDPFQGSFGELNQEFSMMNRACVPFGHDSLSNKHVHGNNGGFIDHGDSRGLYQTVPSEFQTTSSPDHDHKRVTIDSFLVSDDNDDEKRNAKRKINEVVHTRRKRMCDKKLEIVKGQWTPDEDRLLVELVEKHGIRKWSTIAQRLSGRIGKQCRERWHNHLKPDIKKDRWSEEEDKILIEAHRQLGNKWAEIARNLPGRSENTIKNHWNATKRRQLSSRKNGNSSSSKPNTPLQNYIRSVISTTSSDCMDQHSSSSSSISPAAADNALMVNNSSTGAGTSESFLKLSPPLDTDQIHVQFDLQKEIDFMEMLSYGYI